MASLSTIDYVSAGLMPNGQNMILDMLKNDDVNCKRFMSQVNWSIYSSEVREKIMLIYALIVKKDKDIPNITEVVNKIEQSFNTEELKQFMNQITSLKCGVHKENECCEINKDKFALLSFLGEYVKTARYYIGKVLQEACYAGHKSCVNEILNGFISYPSCCIAALQLNEKSVKNLAANKMSQESVKYFTKLLFEKLKQSGGVYSMISWAQTKGCENIMYDLAAQHGIDVEAALKAMPKSRRRYESDSPNKHARHEIHSPNRYLTQRSSSPNRRAPEIQTGNKYSVLQIGSPNRSEENTPQENPKIEDTLYVPGMPRMGNYQRRFKDDSTNWRTANARKDADASSVSLSSSYSSSSGSPNSGTPNSGTPNNGSPRLDISPPRNKSPVKYQPTNVLFPYGRESPLTSMTGPMLISSMSTNTDSTPSLFAYQHEIKKPTLYVPPARRQN